MYKQEKNMFRIPTFIGLGSALIFSSIAIASDENSGDCYQLFSAENYSLAKQQCQELAELGDAKAAFLLANIYYQGLDTNQEDQRGLFWDHIAAEKGHPESAYRLGLAYQLGQGVSQSNSKARNWYQQAALAQHSKAQKLLANMFESGAAGEKNPSRAYQWYMRAAQQGLADAQLKVGSMLLDGRGVEANRASAQHWIRKAATAGNANAQAALGVMLTEIDPAESLSWYERSAEQGNGVALQNLALVYYVGQGVEVDHPRAVELAQRAVDTGNKEAVSLLSLMRLETEQQKVIELQAEQQKLSQQIIASIPEKTADERPLPLAPLSNDTVLAEPSAGYSEPEPEALSKKEPEAVPQIERKSEPVSQSGNPYRLKDGWVMRQSPPRFTIQLLYGKEELGVLNYIKQHKLPDSVRYFRTQREAGLFYVLVYGDYGTIDAAREALDDIPELAQKSHWIRKYRRLQELYLAPDSYGVAGQ
ncbi:SPOR domain-containing protein [Amphritea sp.]|uniref:SPOR domain-containing protein n=1 Tax=Amphritea sp. TaxID=1872502 RepID=UPI0025BB78E3|nr:SPOR domain-containing protein [Amphritea sp.]